MSKEYTNSDLKKDEVPSTSVANDLINLPGDKTNMIFQQPAHDLSTTRSSSSILGSSDPLCIRPDSHAQEFEVLALSKRYKITLEQARRMALNAAKRAAKRRERALLQETEIESSLDKIK